MVAPAPSSDVSEGRAVEVARLKQILQRSRPPELKRLKDCHLQHLFLKPVAFNISEFFPTRFLNHLI